MKTVHSILQVCDYIQSAKKQGRKIALVPTMGNLHEGHLSLVKMAKKQADEVIVTIFVNDMQFGPYEDFASYPRTFKEDQVALELLGVHVLFAPNSKEMYPEGAEECTVVRVDALDGMHCGKTRPCFFSGIATVVNKLCNIIQPDIAFFGKKDFQMLQVIKRMVCDLNMPVEVVGVPTVRENDGLAMSSRNNYLTAEEREVAPHVYKSLLRAKDQICNGKIDFKAVQRDAIKYMDSFGLKVDYFNFVNAQTLQLAQESDNSVTILAAAMLGRTRLIDNVSFCISS